MNYQIYYKGQTITVTGENNATIKRIYDLSIPKFKHHFSQELFLFGNNIKLRLRRNYSLLDWNDIANSVLLENDTIIIEPRENVLTSNSQNCHTPKRYDISNIENDLSGPNLKPSDLNISKTNLKVKSTSEIHNEIISSSKSNRYQRAMELQNQSKENYNSTNNFNRNGLRRSLGAAFAPQCDLPSLRENSNYYFGSNSNNSYQKDMDSSDSSISDIHYKHQRPIKRKSNKPGDVQKRYSVEEKKLLSKSAPASPTKPTPPTRSPHTHLSMINAHNVRTIGKKINISILKKPNIGLGFTVVTRDNQVIYGSGADVASSVVILVNKILKNGGASDDGRLKPGDRILEVNSVPVTSLKDATDKLRAITENDTVELLISRIDQNEIQSPANSPIKPARNLPQLTFEISLNSRQKENQQLGLNIHYRYEKDNPPIGPGIYIHSILSQSLAAQQGGLLVNDKLIGVNGTSLDDLNVEETISLLKKAILNNTVLAITVIRDSSANVSTNYTDNKISKSTPNIDHNDTSIKSDSSHLILPNKVIIDQRSRKSRPRQELRNQINNSRYSSSESGSIHDTDNYYSHHSNAFEREGKGRRSMSEKGKFHEDATKYKFYKNSRDGAANSADRVYPTERAYSTLPTASHKKKMLDDQSPPPLPNKAPIKPSQIKIKSAQESGPKSAHTTPNRSASLRDTTASHKSRSPKRYSQTPTHDLPIFNRAMNNSFKKAVQNSNELKRSGQTNTAPVPTASRHQSNPIQTTQSEKEYHNINHYPNKQPIESPNQFPRSNSVKQTDKKKFNIKDFLSFTPNVSQSMKFHHAGKSDTFPPDKQPDPQLPNYQSVNLPETKHRTYSPHELAGDFQCYKDQTIIDSTKRVLEWQRKNADVISKENSKYKDNKIYQPINAINNDNRIQKAKVDLNVRVSSASKGPIQYHYETDPYDTIDMTISSPNGKSKIKTSRSHPRSANSAIYGVTGASPSSKNGVTPRSNIVIPYQTNSNSRKTMSNATDIYATVNKSSKKEVPNKQSSNISQIHRNKYKF